MNKAVVIGDSWGRYPVPFSGGGISQHLPAFLGSDWNVVDVAHPGDATEETLSLTHRDEIESAFKGATAAVISSGGDTLAGPQMVEWLNENRGQGISGAINKGPIEKAIGLVGDLYAEIGIIRDEIQPDCRLYAHTYDYAIPSNTPVTICGIPVKGPWMYPSLMKCGWTNPDDQAAIVRAMLNQLAASILGAAFFVKNLTVIETRGILSADDWRNELHPNDDGFAKITEPIALAIVNSK